MQLRRNNADWGGKKFDFSLLGEEEQGKTRSIREQNIRRRLTVVDDSS
jgi:hypothetical protein